jgi:peptidoglycan/xylan/chitin deacetylase (PgdA/CDA1 family)
MLHRIGIPNENGIWYNQHLRLSPRNIENMVEYARKRKCRFVSLDEMRIAIRKKKNVRRWIAITLDDGYRDNYQNGVSLFRKLNVPYTIYVCTKMVKGEMLYWWEILEQLILGNDQIILNDRRTFDCSTKETKEQAFLDIREIILKLPQDNLLDRLKELFENYEIGYNLGNDSLGLTWEQIAELKREPLATIGNHTYSHCAFTGCTDDEICADIKHAADDIRVKTGISMQHFAFPFGEATAVSQHNVDLIKQLGFKTSATTKDDLVCYGTDPLELPRLFVTERNWKQVIDRIANNC